MPDQNQKLGLNWFNKDKTLVWDGDDDHPYWVSINHIKVNEPRIFIDEKIIQGNNLDPYSKSETIKKSNLKDMNLLIHGDSLLALKSIERNFVGAIKLIFIDPPFNTGEAFEHYDDGLEHSIWLGMMKSRLDILQKLLTPDGVIVVQIDYREEARLKILMDEIFTGNFRNAIVVKRGTKNVQQQFETIDSLSTGHDTLLVYTKNSDTRFPHCKSSLEEIQEGNWNNHWRGTDRPTMRYELFGITPKTGQWRWWKDRSFEAITNYKNYLEYCKTDESISIDDYYSMHLVEQNIKLDFLRLSKTGKPEHYIPPRSFRILGDVWMDVRTSGKTTDFPHEKHEDLLFRILNWLTKPGDWVLDSFLGSGTTAAVAHKMNRRWIGIELGDQATTLALPRLKKIVQGKDSEGISNLVNWKGGGSFRYCKLGPSLFKIDNDDIVNINLHGNDLIHSICKIESFEYGLDSFSPFHGKVDSKRFCYVTEKLVTSDLLDSLSSELAEDETLVVYSMKFLSDLVLPHNIEIKKIPRDIIKGYELNHLDLWKKPMSKSQGS